MIHSSLLSLLLALPYGTFPPRFSPSHSVEASLHETPPHVLAQPGAHGSGSSYHPGRQGGRGGFTLGEGQGGSSLRRGSRVGSVQIRGQDPASLQLVPSR